MIWHCGADPGSKRYGECPLSRGHAGGHEHADTTASITAPLVPASAIERDDAWLDA